MSRHSIWPAERGCGLNFSAGTLSSPVQSFGIKKVSGAWNLYPLQVCFQFYGSYGHLLEPGKHSISSSGLVEIMPMSTQSNSGGKIMVFAVLHFIFCGLPLLLLSGVSLAFITPYWPVAAGVLALLGIVGFVWYFKRGCASCPRNEGRRVINPKI